MSRLQDKRKATFQCDAAKCEKIAQSNGQRRIPTGWYVVGINDQYSHFCSRACIARWAKSNPHAEAIKEKLAAPAA